MKQLLLTPFLLCGLLLGLPAAAQYTPVAFNSTTPQSLPLTGRGLTFFSGGLISISGSVDYAGSSAVLSGTTVIGGDLRLRASSPLQVTGRLYVYGNVYIQDGALEIGPLGQVFFYGNQFGFDPPLSGATARVTGGGTLSLISPRPASGRMADGQQRALSADGLPGSAGVQYLDGGGQIAAFTLEHRAASGLSLQDLNGDGVADFGITGNLTLGVDNAPLVLGSNTLTLDQSTGGGTVKTYSPARYVQTNATGRLRVTGLPGGAGFTFPIGHAATGDYTPVRATNAQSAAETLAARVTHQQPANSTAASATPTVGRYWELVAADPTAPFDLVLEHPTNASPAAYNDNAAAVQYFDGTRWDAGPAPTAGTTPGSLSTDGPVNGASDLARAACTTTGSASYFTKAGAFRPLPVTLTDFTAQHKSGTPNVELNWLTASELNNAGFEVERARDGRVWSRIGSVAGHGTSAQRHAYALATPYVGEAYYRLRQVDTNGTATYSPVRFIAADGTVAPFTVYPNPSNGEFTLTGTDPTQPVQIISALGQVVAELPAGTTTRDLTGQLASGIYIVRQGRLNARLHIK